MTNGFFASIYLKALKAITPISDLLRQEDSTIELQDGEITRTVVKRCVNELHLTILDLSNRTLTRRHLPGTHQ